MGGVGVPGGTDVAPPPPWEGRAIATHKLRLVEFSAFVEHPRDPDTVRTYLSLASTLQDNVHIFYGPPFLGLLQRSDSVPATVVSDHRQKSSVVKRR